MFGNNRSKSTKRKAMFVIAMLAILVIGLSSNVYAQFPTPKPPPDEHGRHRGEWCNVPGVVINNSDSRVRILGDTWENGVLVWKQYDLTRGQRSTTYLCDTDYIGHPLYHWKFDKWVISPWVWSPYIYNTTYTCRNATVLGTASFQCLFTKWNWGPQ